MSPAAAAKRAAGGEPEGEPRIWEYSDESSFHYEGNNGEEQEAIHFLVDEINRRESAPLNKNNLFTVAWIIN